ncbi:MAG: hypothetical protein U0744_03415 [Gemmataceae bacterium]
MFGEGFAERVAGLDVFDHVDEGVFQRARLHLVFENLEAAKHGQAGVLKHGELPSEGHEIFGFDPAEGHDLAFFPLLGLDLLLRAFLAAGLGRDFR